MGLISSFPGNGRKRDPNKLFGGTLGDKKGAPNGPFFRESFVSQERVSGFPENQGKLKGNN